VAVTSKCVTANVVVVEPAGILTEAGTLATLGFELLSVTTVPPYGVRPVKLTVPVTVV